MAKPGFNFTFGAPATPVQPQQQQPAAAPASQLQVPSLTFGAASSSTATKSTAPTTGFSFGTPITTTTAPPTGGISFGVTPATSAGVSLGLAAPATAAAPSGFGGFSGFGTPAPNTAPASASVTPATQPGLSTTFTVPTIGLTLATPSTTATTTTATPQPSVAVPSFTGPAVTSTAPGLTLAPLASSTSTAPSLSVPSLTAAAPATASTTSTTGTATVSTTTVGPKTAMKFGELEQLVASRRAELEQAGRAFIQLAAVLANRDAELRRSAVKLVGAEAELDRLRMTAETLDRELDYADTQTTELEGIVEEIERQLGGAGAVSSASVTQQTGAAGGDRASTLQMAVTVDAQLRTSARQLRSLSERVNSITGQASLTGLNQRGGNVAGGAAAGASSGSGMATLTRLLDSQLRLLEWAESTSSQLQRRIDGLSNRMGGAVGNPGHYALGQTIMD